MKVYGMNYELGEVPPETITRAKHAAELVLPQPARTKERYGIAFVIVHQGQDASWLLVDWWGFESILHHRLMTAPLSGVEAFQPAPTGLTACVWELPLLMYERDAWVRSVLTAHERPDIGGYLNSRFEGEV